MNSFLKISSDLFISFVKEETHTQQMKILDKI